MVAKAIGTLQAAGFDTSTCHGPGGTASATVATTAPSESSPPVLMPASAPVTDNPRHHTPSTSNGQNVEAATANAKVTVVASPIDPIAGDSTAGTAVASSAATRKLCTPSMSPEVSRYSAGRTRSWSRAPVTATASPEAVDRNAANAPAARSASNALPAEPSGMTCGSSSIIASAGTRPCST